MREKSRVICVLLCLLACLVQPASAAQAQISQDEIKAWTRLWSISLGRPLTPQEQTRLARALTEEHQADAACAKLLAEYDLAGPELQQAMRFAVIGVFREISRRAPNTPAGQAAGFLLPADPQAVAGSEFFEIPTIGEGSYNAIERYLLNCAQLIEPGFGPLTEDQQTALGRNLMNSFAVSSTGLRQQYRTFDAEYGLAYLAYQCGSSDRSDFLSLYAAVVQSAELTMLPKARAAIPVISRDSIWAAARQSVYHMPDSFAALQEVSCNRARAVQ